MSAHAHSQAGPGAPTSAEGMPIRRLTVPEIRARKGAEKLVVLTAYTAPMARLFDPHCDVLLVGDSLAMVLYGEPTTLGAGLDRMIAHGRAVVTGSRRSLVVVDMPFGSYETGPADAFRSAARVLAESGCAGVKLEGGRSMAETVAYLTARGVPVMGHVGLTPQSVHMLGGFRAQGRNAEDGERIVSDAKAIAEAGAFAIVLEAVYRGVADRVAQECPVPVIGIGASPACDGQVLVSEDMLGIGGGPAPRFVRRFGAVGTAIDAAVARYAAEVRAGLFPAAEEMYGSGAGATSASSMGPRKPGEGGGA